MANSNSLFTIALIGGAAYLVYNWWTSQASTAVAPAVPVTPTTPAAPSVAYVPPTQAQQLQTAAGSGVTVLDADQWSFYWQQLNLPAVDGGKWNSLFFPNGRPPAGSAAPTMTAQAYVSALQGAGLAGYRQGIPVPVGRGMGAFYTLGDLRRAGGR